MILITVEEWLLEFNDGAHGLDTKLGTNIIQWLKGAKKVILDCKRIIEQPINIDARRSFSNAYDYVEFEYSDQEEDINKVFKLHLDFINEIIVTSKEFANINWALKRNKIVSRGVGRRLRVIQSFFQQISLIDWSA